MVVCVLDIILIVCSVDLDVKEGVQQCRCFNECRRAFVLLVEVYV